MKSATFTEFRKNASLYFNEVENGEKIRITRHGKPIAWISPCEEDSPVIPSWKTPGLKLKIAGISLGREIIRDRLSEKT